MKTIQKFCFDELSKNAQEKALQDWKKSIEGDEYMAYKDFNTVINVIENVAGVSILFDYDTTSYNFDIIGSLGDIRGVRAAKKTLNLYYKLTESKQIFGKLRQTNEYFRLPTKKYQPSQLKNLFTKYIPSYDSVEEMFTDSDFSSVFTSSLFKSVRINSLKKDFSIKQHIEFALNVLFDDLIEDYMYYHSDTYFYENSFCGKRYSIDGAVIN